MKTLIKQAIASTLKWVTLLFVLGAISSNAHATLLNSDFSAGFDNWQGAILGDPLPDPFTDTIIDPDDYSNNYSITGNSATMTHAFDIAGNDIFSVVLFQDFVLAASAPGSMFELSLDVATALINPDDSVIAQLRDLDGSLTTLNLLTGGNFDITNWIGVNATIEFGVQDEFDFVLGDSITISNLSITETVNDIPEPSTLLLFVFLLGAIRCNATKHN